MAGTFKIIENTSDAIKFLGMVSFNEKLAQYYEVDLDVVDRAVEDLQKEQAVAKPKRAAEINQEITDTQERMTSLTEYVLSKLQEVADQDAIQQNPAIENELQAIA